MEISNFSDKKFKVMVIKMFMRLGRRMDEHSRKSTKQKSQGEKYKT